MSPVDAANAMVDRLVMRAWQWGHGCSTDDISVMSQTGDSYNEGGRDDTQDTANAIKRVIADYEDKLARMTESRDNTRMALEKMRAYTPAVRPILSEISRLEREYGFDRPDHQLQPLMLPLSDLKAFQRAFSKSTGEE